MISRPTIWHQIGEANVREALVPGVEQRVRVHLPAIFVGLQLGLALAQLFPVHLKVVEFSLACWFLFPNF